MLDGGKPPGLHTQYTNRLTNRVEAERILAHWATLLRDQLDEIHGKSEK